MSDADPMLASPERCVTASDLVRQFGLWQERALQNPVFVLRRGRPSLVLTSLDLMRRLCEPHARGGEREPLVDLMLDSMREAVLVVDGGDRLVRSNRASRIAFPGAIPGAALHEVMPQPAARLLHELGERARRAGAADQADVAIADRHLAVAIVPLGADILYIANDVTAEIEADLCAARIAALDEGVDLFDDVAWARVNLRGYVEATSATLSRLTGIDAAMLRATRFVTLVALESRTAVGEAVEGVLADGIARRLDIRLADARGAMLDAALAITAERPAGRTTAITALIRANPTPGNSA